MFSPYKAVSVSKEQMFGVHKCRENGILKRPWEGLLLECGQQQTVSLSVRYLWKESERSKNSCVQMAGVVRSVEYPPIAQAEEGRLSLFPMLRPNHSWTTEDLTLTFRRERNGSLCPESLSHVWSTKEVQTGVGEGEWSFGADAAKVNLIKENLDSFRNDAWFGDL